MNSLAENQINKFISGRIIKSRRVLSQAFNMQCENIVLEDNKSFIIKYYKNKRGEFNSIISESNSLQYLSKNKLTIFPKVEFNSDKLLITKYINHNNLKKKNYQINLANEIIKIHNITNNKYGFKFDTQIGGLKQPNRLETNWVNFFKNKRLHMIFEKINKDKPMPKSINQKIEKLINNIENFIPKNPSINLLHGDLWEGNILFNNGNLVGLIDPGIYFGHNELEIAYLTWFKYVDNKFLDYYSNFIKIDKYFNKYEPIYQLYFSLLNISLWNRKLYLKDTNNLLNKIFRKKQ